MWRILWVPVNNEITINPILREKFLTKLSQQIDEILQRESPWIQQITVDSVTEENFDDKIRLFREQSGHAGIIYFLGECISEGKCLDKVTMYLTQKKESKVDLAWATFEDLDFFNLSSRLEFRKKSDESEIQAGKSFSLSGSIGFSALSQIGYIREHYARGWRIRSLSGTSLGAIIAVCIAKVVVKKTGNEAVQAIDSMVDSLKECIKKIWKAEKSDIAKMEDIFLRFAQSIWITQDMKFSDLDIPVIINASFQSKDGNGEKEVIISWDNILIDSLFVGINVPKGTKNVWILGTRKLQWLGLVDFATNEKGNPISLLTRNGVQKKDMISLDTGYTSIHNHSFLASFSRWYYRLPIFRDMIEKSDIRMFGWQTIDFKMRWSWLLLNSESIDTFMKDGSQRYRTINHPTSPSLQ